MRIDPTPLAKPLLLSLLALLSTSGFAQSGQAGYDAWAKSSGMKAGLYEYRVVSEMTGLPGIGSMKVPAMTFTHCVTQKDIDDGKQMFNNQKNSQMQCSMTQFNANADGKGGQYAYQCEGSGSKMSTTGSFEQNGTTQNHKTKMVMTGQGANVNSNNQMDIKRLGDCK